MCILSIQKVTLQDDNDSSIQSRPLPTPPTPRRRRKTPTEAAAEEDDDTTLAEPFQSVRSSGTLEFHSLRSAASATLVETPKDPAEEEQGDDTLAESIVDSMHTCLDTLPSTDHPRHSADNTLDDPGMASDEENEEFMAEMLPHDKDVTTPTP